MKSSTFTEVYGIFGFPLSHSLSPAMQNAAFKKLKMKAVYLPLEISERDLMRQVKLLKKMPLTGFNITIPHKEHFFKWCDHLSNDAKGVGAVNTVKRIDGKWHGFNTDTCGFMEAVLQDGKWNPEHKTIVVLGSGGAARAIAYSLAQKNAKTVIIVNRTLTRAKRLTHDLQKQFPKTRFEALALKRELLKRALSYADALIQTTSVGLKKTDPSLVPQDVWPKRKMFVMDLIYNPRQTRLLKEAKKRGHKTLDGLSMLLYQGVKAFQLWTGRTAPVSVMRRALLKEFKHQS